MNTTLQTLMSQYEDAVSTGDLAGACRYLSEVIAQNGEQPDLLTSLGTLLLALGRKPEAEEAAWRSIALDRKNQETLRLLGRIAVRNGRPQQHALQPLPGTRYAKYALPLDYPPSRNMSLRWGYSIPAHAGLSALFARNHREYQNLIAELRTLVPHLGKIRPDYSGATAPEPGWVGAPINALDLALLYYFVWKHRPATYLEIGSGATTCFARRAVKDHGLPTRILSIDPEPRAAIDSICDEVLRDGLETLPNLQVFADLQPGDIVFMDGSHRCFMNSDVTVFFLDVLPLLKPGVIVHIHDIVLPFDYPEWAKNWYWSEQYMLAVYLLGMGDRIKILMPSQYLGHTEGLKDCLEPTLLPGVGDPGVWREGGSFWFTHV